MFMQIINDPDTEASVCARQKLKAAEVRFHAAVFIASLHAADSAGNPSADYADNPAADYATGGCKSEKTSKTTCNSRIVAV